MFTYPLIKAESKYIKIKGDILENEDNCMKDFINLQA